MAFVGSLDQGTSSSRFMIFDQSGRVVGQHQLEHRQILPQAGWVEHDAAGVWWHDFVTICRQVLATSAVDPARVAGVGVKYVMNFRRNTHPVIVVGTLAALLAAATMTIPKAAAAGPPVTYGQVRTILDARCTGCHATKPTLPGILAPPKGVIFDTPADVVANKERIFIQSVHTKAMPLGNLTGMTDDERAALGRWIAQGAPTE